MNESKSASTMLLRAALVLQLLFVSSVFGNLFETHYKTLLGNLAGQSLEDVFDGMSVEELEHNAESFTETCLNETDLEAVYTIADTSSLTDAELVELCPALLYRALVAAECAHDDHDDHDGETTGYGYTYGSLAVLIISLSPVLGLPLVLINRNSIVLQMIIQFLIAVGVSALACDSLLHLWPEAVGLHGHGEEGHDEHAGHGEAETEGGHDRTYLWRTMVLVITMYAFYLFETLFSKIFHHHHSHSVNPMEETSNLPDSLGGKNTESGTSSKASSQIELTKEGSRICGIPNDKFVTAITISAGDFLCNFVDGMAIGIGFQSSGSSGFSSAIAVFCHELPQELASFALLLDMKLHLVAILVLNLFSALGAFMGLYIASALSEYDQFMGYMTAIAAGAFLYIAFMDMYPEMLSAESKQPWILYIVQNIGLIIGFVILLLIALYEEDIGF
ncbi:zinc transporter ZIP4-like [Symsagittifera roscoffensis]|uniref:zinc transporter ZIP4-like n=1 Tax=Symsagittifera roscoffensis TaxID=84072 RepID=UPI00307BDEFF